MERKRQESEWRNLVVQRRRLVLSSIERALGFVLCVLSFVFWWVTKLLGRQESRESC
jgi:hypothetical protein